MFPNCILIPTFLFRSRLVIARLIMFILLFSLCLGPFSLSPWVSLFFLFSPSRSSSDYFTRMMIDDDRSI